MQKHFFLVLCKYLSADFSSFGLTVPLKATEQSVYFHLSCSCLLQIFICVCLYGICLRCVAGQTDDNILVSCFNKIVFFNYSTPIISAYLGLIINCFINFIVLLLSSTLNYLFLLQKIIRPPAFCLGSYYSGLVRVTGAFAARKENAMMIFPYIIIPACIF